MSLEKLRLPLQAVTKEIARLARLIEQDRSEQRLLGARDVATVQPIENKSGRYDETLVLARDLIAGRQMRAAAFPSADFADPQWDMLLDLYVSERLQCRISISSACIASQVPPTTALRHLSAMVTAGLIEKIDDTNDGRRIFVRITAQAMSAMDEYLNRVLVKRCHVRAAA